MEVDERITLTEYDPLWPTYFEIEKQTILESLEHTIKAVEHFGSTAVPGMVAKPIIDVLVGIDVVPIGRSLIAAFEDLGYEYLAEAGIPGRFYFCKRGEVAFNVAVVEWNGRLWQDNLLLRDFLRSHAEYAHRYIDLKRSAIKSGIVKLLDYSAYKNQFITEMLQVARKL